MPNLFIDFETRSTVELRRTGVYPYAAHRDTFVWCMAWAFDEEPAAVWKEGEPLPERVLSHIAAGGSLWAHNANFERTMWRECAIPKYGFPVVRDSQWNDTAAEVAAMGLPRALADVCAVLELPMQKDRVGHALMQKLCRPRSMNDAGEPVWWNEPAMLADLYKYCVRDVDAERGVWKRARRLTPNERRVYLLDQLVNDRGVYLDRDLAVKVRAGADAEVARQNATIRRLTGGSADKATQVQRIKDWLSERGLDLDSLRKSVLRDLLDDETSAAALEGDVADVLEARRQASKSSLAKIDRMLECVGVDGRMRGLLMYHGAHTGRWSGRLVQPQNFPRALDVPNPEQHIERVLDGTLAIRGGGPSFMAIYSALLRPMLTAAPGHRLLSADFATIEVRVTAWLAGCQLMLDQFAGGRSPYKEIAAEIYGTTADQIVKPSAEYQIGKMVILACGFGMGAEKFVKQVKEQEGVDVDPGLAKQAVTTYRNTYHEIERYWRRVNACAVDAVSHPGEVFAVGEGAATVKFTARSGFLWVILPSGRPLAYFKPRVVMRAVPWDASDLRPSVEYSGYSSYTHQWERLTTYGGSLTENIVQAVARDLLADAMLRVEDNGYEVVLTVHDEIVAEIQGDSVPGGSGAFDDFLAIVQAPPAWAAGLPIAAEGWEGARYRK